MTSGNGTPVRGMKLSAKFSLSIGLAVLLMLAVLVGIQTKTARNDMERAVESKGQDLADLVAISAVQPILNYDSMTLQSLATEVVKDDAVAYAICEDKGGNPLCDVREETEAEIREFVADIPAKVGDPLGVVRIGIDPGPYEAQRVSAVRSIVLSLGVAGFMLGATLIVLLRRQVIVPLRRACGFLDQLAQGDLTAVPTARGGDELAVLIRTIAGMAEQLHDHVQRLARTADRLGQTSTQMHRVTAEIDERVHRQQLQTDQVAGAVTEMAATAHQVADNASDAAAAAESADSSTRQGQAVVGETIESVQLLLAGLEGATAAIERVSHDSKAIGSVLDVIRGVSEQTNLLALNAAIEAARAGEQGRGFAVVADEVRNLATSTQVSTRQIEEMIQKLQEGAMTAVEAMQEGRERAEVGVEQARAAGTALESIAERVAQVSERAVVIASVVGEQSTTTEHLNQNLVTIAEIAGQSSSGAQQISSAASQISELVGELQAAMGSFRI
ncbi:MAG: methyl-accepting chemotaxis protein [Candidatus Eisenbacteria bacterium]|uniref:Methyl-accepting chemotaxis protein n=1 Tax=Eiseniibacteriota bacterium TaxID=2212470 RepID=A0A956NFA2_UNCEI|nr:methyl-accepting chemotaxis protein [Candidatus Eisenbacteria bacterium]MCB9466325.1 methyl-accepting chemotaxis protein [Candidatus Eisenbacteria bacterium]